jgi:hypothetical protein
MDYNFFARVVGRPNPSRKIVTGRRDCFTGEFTSSKEAMGCRRVAYEGILAGDVMMIFDRDPNVVSYREEAPPFRWSDGDNYHLYWPDVEVNLVDGRKICVEAKPKRKIQKYNLDQIFPMIEVGALEAGYDAFEIWSEDKVYRGARLANARLVASEAINPVESFEAQHEVLSTLLRLGGRARIGNLRRSTTLGVQGYRTIIKLIAKGQLRWAQTHKEIDDLTEVYIPH